MTKNTSIKAKAKQQKAVSRAVKEAGFKNIKEAKQVLKTAQCEVGETCGHSPKKSEYVYSDGYNLFFAIPRGEPYQVIHEELNALLEEPGVTDEYLYERINYLCNKYKTIKGTLKEESCSNEKACCSKDTSHCTDDDCCEDDEECCGGEKTQCPTATYWTQINGYISYSYKFDVADNCDIVTFKIQN